MYISPYNTGIIYAKISKNDISGSNHLSSLENLNQFRIIYDDIGVIHYNVLEIGEFNSYFLYKLIPINNTSSLDNNILNYRLLVNNINTASFVPQGISEFPTPPARFVNFNQTVIDSQSAFLTPWYTFPNTTPSLIVSFSIVDNSVLGDQMYYYLYSNQRDILYITQSNGGASFLYTGSFFTNERIAVSWANLNPITSSLSNPGILSITQSINPNDSINQVIFIPYLFENFYNSDNNVLVNNISEMIESNKYMDVDYISHTIPVNFNQIISGTATRANISDYYYNLKRHILPRYEGSKLQTAYINNYYGRQTDFVFVNNDNANYSGDIGFGNTTNIKVLNVELFEFKWANTVEPMIPGCSQISMGNILEVTTASDSGGNLRLAEIQAEVELISNKNNLEAYSYIISSSFNPGNEVTLNQRSTNEIIENLIVETTDFGVPTIPNYWIPTNITSSVGSGDYLSKWNSSFDAFELGFMRKVVKTSDYIKTDELTEPIYQYFNELTSSINNGDQWYMTISSRIDSPLENSIIPWNYGYNDGLEQYGVYKIISASGPTPQLLFFDRPLLTTASTTFSADKNFGSGSNKNGMFLWKSIKNKEKYVIIKGAVSNIGKGYIIPYNSSDSINRYYNYILLKYGESSF